MGMHTEMEIVVLSIAENHHNGNKVYVGCGFRQLKAISRIYCAEMRLTSCRGFVSKMTILISCDQPFWLNLRRSTSR